MPRVYFIRHVESEANRAGVGLGHEDSQPTALGLRQRDATAAALAEAGIARVLTSPLTRARTLAEAIAEASGAVVEPREELLELDVGELEGLPFAEARERYGDFISAWRGEESARIPFPGGESLAQLQERAWPAVESLVHAEAEEEGAVAVVSHNFVLRVLLARALGMAVDDWRRIEAGLASVSVVRSHPRTPVLELLNDRSHVRGLEQAERRGRE